jgi:Cof subfamily protein (haloacid dehalogenase superfamily)
MRLFAMDLDGTLLDRDGRVRPRDAAAIAEARRQGIVVTIATGRLTTGTLPVARELGLDAPLVCADGAVTAWATTGRVLDRRPIATMRAAEVLSAARARGLASFVFNPGHIHSCARGVPHHGYVGTWSRSITTHEDVEGAAAWRADPDGVVMVLAIGARDAVDDLVARMAVDAPDLEVLAFGLEPGRVHCARFIARGVSKGAALEALAARLGARQADVACAGDWQNDLPMFAWAGRSFAMPHAPEDVKAAATDRLEEGVAEALMRWMAER